MNKLIIYTITDGKNFTSFSEAFDYGVANRKLRICQVKPGTKLSTVKEGDLITTGKKATLYVVKTFNQSMEQLDVETRHTIDRFTSEYNMRYCGIDSVANVTRAYREKANNNLCNNKKVNNMNKISEKIRETIMPREASDLRVTFNGEIAVPMPDGSYNSIAPDGSITSYPENFTFAGIPAFTVCKPVTEIQAGDIIQDVAGKYVRVNKLKGTEIYGTSYAGTGRHIVTIKDFVLNNNMVRVVISMNGAFNGGSLNPMMLLAMSEGSDGNMTDKLLPLMLMSQNGGAGSAINPMMFALMCDNEGSSLKDMALMSMMAGNGGANPFAGLFGGATQVAAPANNAEGQKTDISKQIAELTELVKSQQREIDALKTPAQPEVVTPVPSK